MANAAHRQLFMRAHEPLLAASHLRGRVKVFERLDLPSQLQSVDYTVFHQSDHINYFNALCRLRDRYGSGFPVTAFIHSISYQEYMPRYLQMSLAGPGPSDALICSSRCGRTALENVACIVTPDTLLRWYREFSDRTARPRVVLTLRPRPRGWR